MLRSRFRLAARPALLTATIAALSLASAAPAHAVGPGWDFGLRLDAVNFSSTGSGGDDYSGVGTLARYRYSTRWGVELAADFVHSEDWGDDSFQWGGEIGRDMYSADVNVLYYISSHGVFDFYGVGGLGSVVARWYDPYSDTTYGRASGAKIQVGCGAQLRLGPVRLYSDLRLFAVAPFEKEGLAGGTYYLRRDAGQHRIIEDPRPRKDDDPMGGTMFTMGVNMGW